MLEKADQQIVYSENSLKLDKYLYQCCRKHLWFSRIYFNMKKSYVIAKAIDKVSCPKISEDSFLYKILQSIVC